jgi:hypothetical protein
MKLISQKRKIQKHDIDIIKNLSFRKKLLFKTRSARPRHGSCVSVDIESRLEVWGALLIESNEELVRIFTEMTTNSRLGFKSLENMLNAAFD